MNSVKNNLSIIFHSGSYDRIYNGFSIALTALSIGRNVKLLFTYWSLEYVMRDNLSILKLDMEAEKYRELLGKKIEKGHLEKIPELFTMTKKLEGKIYACLGSMALLNITGKDLIDEVDKSIGLPEFLIEVEKDQLLFI